MIFRVIFVVFLLPLLLFLFLFLFLLILLLLIIVIVFAVRGTFSVIAAVVIRVQVLFVGLAVISNGDGGIIKARTQVLEVDIDGCMGKEKRSIVEQHKGSHAQVQLLRLRELVQSLVDGPTALLQWRDPIGISSAQAITVCLPQQPNLHGEGRLGALGLERVLCGVRSAAPGAAVDQKLNVRIVFGQPCPHEATKVVVFTTNGPVSHDLAIHDVDIRLQQPSQLRKQIAANEPAGCPRGDFEA